MSDYKTRATQITPTVYQQFRRAIETGKWPDGRSLTEKQKEIVMETIILYEHANMDEVLRTGQLEDQCVTATQADVPEQPIKLQ